MKYNLNDNIQLLEGLLQNLCLYQEVLECFTFTRDSFSVQFWLKQIREGKYDREDVPNLFNLREVVFEILDEHQYNYAT